MRRLGNVSRLIATAFLIADSTDAAASTSSAPPRPRRRAPGPVAIGIRSAVAHGLLPLPAWDPDPALAFSGGKALPPPAPRPRRQRRLLDRPGRTAGPSVSAPAKGDRGGRRRGGKARDRPAGGQSPRLPMTTTGTGSAAAISAPKPAAPPQPLSFWEAMICGAVSRSVAHTAMHPANAMKTILQTSPSSLSRGGVGITLSSLARPTGSNLRLLTRGAGAQFLLAVPQGAVSFAVLECVRGRARDLVYRWSDLGDSSPGRSGPVGAGLDFLSSAASTVCCSVISTPISMVNDNIMAGAYPSLRRAVVGIASEGGLGAFYTGWWPNLCGKIPSYGLTWACFQRLKEVHRDIFDRPPNDLENSAMGCLASACVVCVMMPMDTIKTRIMTQGLNPAHVPYTGMRDCAARILNEEGFPAFYRGLTPRLLSVVPTMGIQFGVYECMKRIFMERSVLSQEADWEEGATREKSTEMARSLHKN